MNSPAVIPPELRQLIQEIWGFPVLRPLQSEAMLAEVEGVDSLVVLPTGGGKSLCYQAPAVFRGGTTVVVSPLIALMKDQVDSLRQNGVAAVRLDSTLEWDELSDAESAIAAGQIRLVFLSPERLVTTACQSLLRTAKVSTFVIDEAHCISHWGHDFRPEYRQMGQLREFFPNATIHAYTATATGRVQQDIVAQLHLRAPRIHVGNFDRPNLIYRVAPRVKDLAAQVREVLDRHSQQAGIIYCISRANVDMLSELLRIEGRKVVPYHAGMSNEDRKRSQNAFMSEAADIVVATVAFGMGIDRPDVRFVLHTGMPKSLEHYQQEAGRAGRDGDPAECVLLYSAQDGIIWRKILEKQVAEGKLEPNLLRGAVQHVREMDQYARNILCRHRILVEHFGQKFQKPNCSACDVCLGGRLEVPDSSVVAQKILSCVARVKESFGLRHVAAVLHGENSEPIRRHEHEKLSTFGLLQQTTVAEIREWITQLLTLGVLDQTEGEYPVLKLNAESWKVMRKERSVVLYQLETSTAATSAKPPVGSAEPPLTPQDEELFEELRQLRRTIATREGVPPYVILHDSVLRDLARNRPRSVADLLRIPKIGDVKAKKYASEILPILAKYPQRAPDPPKLRSMSPRKQLSFQLFRQHLAIEDVMHQTGLSRGTVCDHLCEFVKAESPADISMWLTKAECERIIGVAKSVGGDRLKPIFDALNGTATYEQIRLALAFDTIAGVSEE